LEDRAPLLNLRLGMEKKKGGKGRADLLIGPIRKWEKRRDCVVDRSEPRTFCRNVLEGGGGRRKGGKRGKAFTKNIRARGGREKKPEGKRPENE